MGDDVVQRSASPGDGTDAKAPEEAAQFNNPADSTTSFAELPPAKQIGRWYPARHWRGEITLGYSFWGSLAVVFAIGFVKGFLLSLSFVQAQRVYVYLVVTAAIVLFAAGVWQWVGNWRSAGRRIADRHQQNKRAFWAYVVRVVTVIDIGLVLVGTVSNTSLIPADLRAILAVNAVPHHALRILNHGKELALTGGFDLGTAAELQAMLSRYGTVKTIDLSSTGGLVAEAEAVRKAIQERGLSTYTDGLCVSACTLAYIGGNPRYMGPHGKLGFHRYISPGWTLEQDGEANFGGQKSLLNAAIAPDFAAKAFSTPYTAMWYPDAATLRAANVVTQMVNGRAFASTANGELESEEIGRILSGLPAFAALKQADRLSYDDALQSIVEGARAGNSVQQTWGRAESLLRVAETKYQATAGDEIQRELVEVMAAEGQFLSRANPTACLQLFRTIPRSEPDYAVFLSAELDKRDKAVAAAIIRGGASEPVTSLAGSNVMTMIAVLWTRVRQLGYDLAAVGRPPQSADDQRYVCMALSTLMLSMKQLPPAQLGPLMRQLAGASLGPAMPPR